MYVSQSGDLVEKNSTYGLRTALMYVSPPTRATFIGSHDDVFLLQLYPTTSYQCEVINSEPTATAVASSTVLLATMQCLSHVRVFCHVNHTLMTKAFATSITH